MKTIADYLESDLDFKSISVSRIELINWKAELDAVKKENDHLKDQLKQAVTIIEGMKLKDGF